MSRTSSSTRRGPGTGTGSWIVPGAAVVIGVAYLVVGIAHDDALTGALELLVMLGFAAVLVLWRGRSESVALLAGDTSDERRAHLQVQASAATGRVLPVVLVAGLFWSLVTDNGYQGVFTVLCVITGLTVLGATVWHSRRG